MNIIDFSNNFKQTNNISFKKKNNTKSFKGEALDIKTNEKTHKKSVTEFLKAKFNAALDNAYENSKPKQVKSGLDLIF